jgi:hypothetical protein
MKYLGIFLIIAGLITTFYTFNASPEGGVANVKSNSSVETPFQWWPLTGAAISVIGATVVWFSYRKRKNSVRVPKSKEGSLNKPDNLV